MSAALGILSMVAPWIGRAISGTRGAEFAEQAVGIARRVAGEDDALSAAQAIAADPEMQAKFLIEARGLELEFYKAETERLALTHGTMRAEYEAKGIFKTGWRSFLGWVFSLCMGLLLAAPVVCWACLVFTKPEAIAKVFADLATLYDFMQWPIVSVCAVLGVLVKKRSDDKSAAAGAAQAVTGFDLSGAQSALSSVLAKVGGK